MNPREAGFLLLTSQLGNPERKVLTPAQLRTLTLRARTMEFPVEDRELTLRDLLNMGLGPDQAQRVLTLLGDGPLLEAYARRGAKSGCLPITRVNRAYPQRLRLRLGLDCPGCLWAKGDLSLLERPGIALVGSRDLGADNLEFARQVGVQAARQGFVLISGNARGADQAAQNACLEAGGRVIGVVADELRTHKPGQGMLYLAEEGFDSAFSSQRALSRNRIIHALGSLTFVAQATLEKGGSWDGTVKNLRFGWSPVFCLDDGSAAAAQLERMGARLIGPDDLEDFSILYDSTRNLLDQ